MELIRKTGTRINKSGNFVSYGIFWCPSCNQEVEMGLSNGKRNKSCGCNKEKYIIISNKLKGLKRTEMSRKKQSETIKGHLVSEETRQKMRESRKDQVGELSPNWQNGISFEPYGIEFNKELKNFILDRDNYTCQCQECKHITNNLDVHHIDYDKNNNNIENLITLCDSCHMKTNGKNKRLYYTEYYQNIMMGKVIEGLL